MSNFIVYDKNDKTQVMDRPYDMILVKKSFINHEDLTLYHYTNASVLQAVHTPPNMRGLAAWQPRLEPQYANKTHLYRSGGIQGNPMHLYYYSWEYGNNFKKERYGMEVYNEQGDITWASYHTSMHVLDTIDVNDIRELDGDLTDFFRKNYGHKNVAVIPVAVPDFQSGRYFYDFKWCFDEYGSLRIFLKPYLYLDDEEIAMGVFHGNPVFRLHMIIIDLTNTLNFVNP